MATIIMAQNIVNRFYMARLQKCRTPHIPWVTDAERAGTAKHARAATANVMPQTFMR
jgi:hypothetical protein